MMLIIIIVVVIIVSAILLSNNESKDLNSTHQMKESTNQIKTLPDEVTYTDKHPAYQPDLPDGCTLGNLIFEKKYMEAIELGEKMIEQTSDPAGIYINLMVAYFKARNEDDSYLGLSNKYAKLAILNGHNTGYAHQRLIINLTKSGHYHQALEICDLILRKGYTFSSHGMGKKESYIKREEKLLKILPKSLDTEEDRLFTEDEIKQCIDSANQTNKEWDDYIKRGEERIANVEELRKVRREKFNDIFNDLKQ